ncbi:Cell wall-associated hydrolase, NlpC family [Lentzea albidocapillata subsp. violacea]|uniref:Cell wall-associated hydrolase, NlpC family n=1 Tax=Lentzea albidocapillata subsp. violacea TaxID=128104 RepID=A0A1G9TRE2_9PSEU|nr:C40 family peptidase [Lentzea albidocapillata]SDM49685.1 Cell wall-associated hydrolase, NlpC family [Lentzea albidocapillata subsp. violacea]
MPGRAARTTALAAVIAATVVSMPSARAQPADDALKVYNDLTREAEKLSQDHLKAQSDLSRANGIVVAATEAEKKALAESEQFRGQVDTLTEATFEGARLGDLSAFLTSTSQQDFLERMQAMNIIAADQNAAVSRMNATLTEATKARTDATSAAAAAEKLAADVSTRKAAMEQQVSTARTKYQSLSAPQKQTLAAPGPKVTVNAPAGAAGAALTFALGEQGKPYVFGSNGPNSWDCSSLMQAAYRAAGVSIPRVTYDQAKVGRGVGRGEVAPGDLIIYYSGQSHVAMAVDGTRAVHASTEGVPVKIANIDSIGPISVIRRVVG